MGIDEIISEKLKSEVEREVSKQLAPIRSLPERFANKITLSIDEMCEILGLEVCKSSKESIRNACKRGELPFRSFGREIIFPRPMVEAWLFGEWKAVEVEKAKVDNRSITLLASKLR